MKTKLLTTTTLTLAIATTNLQAEEQNQVQAQLACATVTLCQKMASLIQAQIQELETKPNLTTEDKKHRYQLKKQLIALVGTTQKHQEKTITSENKRQEQLREQTNQELAELNSQLADIRGILLDK